MISNVYQISLLARFNSFVEGAATKFSRLNDMFAFCWFISVHANKEVVFFKAETYFLIPDEPQISVRRNKIKQSQQQA